VLRPGSRDTHEGSRERRNPNHQPREETRVRIRTFGNDSPIKPSLIETARATRDRARVSREAAARTRWRTRKERLRAYRLRTRGKELRPAELDDVVEAADLDELIDVLIVLTSPPSSREDGAA
jgi:hypothetical protein